VMVGHRLICHSPAPCYFVAATMIIKILEYQNEKRLLEQPFLKALFN